MAISCHTDCSFVERSRDRGRFQVSLKQGMVGAPPSRGLVSMKQSAVTIANTLFTLSPLGWVVVAGLKSLHFPLNTKACQAFPLVHNFHLLFRDKCQLLRSQRNTLASLQGR